MDIHNCIVGKYVYSIMDTNIQLRQSIMATHDTIMDIHKNNSNLDIQNSIMDIYYSIMNSHNYSVYSHLAFHIAIIMESQKCINPVIMDIHN